MNITNISPIEAAEIHFRISTEKAHYPDDEFIKEFIDAGLNENFIKDYSDTWRALWEDEYDRKQLIKILT